MTHDNRKQDEIPRNRAVFCNRTLNLRSIRAIGYDMDYTLVQYHTARWENLAFEHARRDLEGQGWPVDELVFDPDSMIQGLIVDIRFGNLLKVNRFGYVKTACHGRQMMDFEEQRQVYGREVVDHRDDRYVFLSTLFSLSEGSLFAQAVDLFDAGKLPMIESYRELYRRVRGAIDEAHRQGRLKQEIARNPDPFVERDAEISATLLDQRDASKKLLLITNSDWPYTRQLMSHSFDAFLPSSLSWRDLFDLVIVSARKPDFFLSSSPLLEVIDDEGRLMPTSGPPVQGRIYYGGNAGLIEKCLGVAGDQILYVGDHFFGDVHATKTILRWRTALIVRELDADRIAAERFAAQARQLQALMQEKERLELCACRARLRLQRDRAGREPLSDAHRQAARAELERTRTEIEALDQHLAPLAKASAELGNPTWGPLLRAGNDKSYLGALLERHADVYTSRVANFLRETPFRYFRSARGSLPHEV